MNCTGSVTWYKRRQKASTVVGTAGSIHQTTRRFNRATGKQQNEQKSRKPEISHEAALVKLALDFWEKKKKNAAMIWGFGCGDMDMEYCITAILKCEILSYYFEFLFPGLCVLHSLSSHHYHFLNFSPHGGKEHVFSHTEAKTKRQTSIIYASFTALHSGI